MPWVSLADGPTPLDEVPLAGRPVWVKREGDANAAYGGNKIRTLEAWLGHARESGAKRIWAIGAYGSNHAIATIVHAHRAGLEAGAALFPQPQSPWAAENCGAMIASGAPLVHLRSVAEVPFVGAYLRRRDRGSIVMPPGGATPIGTFGALSAALELAEQIAERKAPPPARIVLAVGSTCTIAGLVAGIALAQQIGAWPWPVPLVHGVRVTPWPITSRVRIAHLAQRTLARVASLGGPPVALGLPALVRRLVVDGAELGAGYGRQTPRGEVALHALPGVRLDAVYSAKAAAALVRLQRANVGPLLFWATKSSAILAPPTRAQFAAAPAALARYFVVSERDSDFAAAGLSRSPSIAPAK